MASFLSSMTIRAKLFFLLVFCMVGLLVLGTLSWTTLNLIKVNGTMYQRIVLNKDLVADILPPPEYIVESFLTVYEILH